MDSNVSKNTNSHNFFKLQLNHEKLGISIKNLLKHELLFILDLYQQKLNVQLEQKLVTTILSKKLKISQSKNTPTFREKSIINSHNHSSPANFLPIIYACPLGMSLSATFQQSRGCPPNEFGRSRFEWESSYSKADRGLYAPSPQTIMEQLICLLTVKQNQLDTTDQDFSGQLLTELVPLGWLNFHLDSQLIANWLQRSLFWGQSNTANYSDFLKQTSGKLFPAQYIHARCCNLLGLGARENLIILSNNAQQIELPESISWLDQEHQLWLTEVTEHDLLQQLLIASDSWVENTNVHNHLKYWSKLSLSLSQKTAIFLAECRFLGEVKQQYPQKAIARLGLIALVQFWLEKILVEKLGVAAPREL